MTPFEFFRTTIEIRRFSNEFYLNGKWITGTRLAISTDLITGNVFNATINGVAVVAPFNTSNALTMLVIANLIKVTVPGIQDVLILSASRQLQIIPYPNALADVTAFSVTGGVTQPVTSQLDGFTIIPATASIQPTKGQEVELLPEGRRDSEIYKFYTSTQIYGIEPQNPLQNPDQVTVLKGPFTGLVFEVVQINTWQNNSNFNIVNHYKYLAMRLHPLP
jgi:hypothetical protein